MVLDGPEVDSTGLSAWTLPELCREVERRWDVRYHPGHMSKLVRGLGLSRQKARPARPKVDPEAQAAFKKRLRDALEAVRAAHPGKRLTLWWELAGG